MQLRKVLLAVAISGAACGALALPAAAESPLDGVLPAAEIPTPPAGEIPTLPGGELPAPPGGELPAPPVGEPPALPAPLGPSAETEPEAEPAADPNLVSPDDCIAGGGNVERTEADQEIDAEFYCNGGTADGKGIQYGAADQQ